MSDPRDTPEQRLARWAERDAVVGLDAELTQARRQLAAREAEVRDLRVRIEQLSNRLTQLELERNGLQHRVTSLAQPSPSRRVYGLVRRTAGRTLRAAGLR